eukprot:scaffold516409_cov42-Prasinocladus_malaysianus.AAC.1
MDFGDNGENGGNFLGEPSTDMPVVEEDTVRCDLSNRTVDCQKARQICFWSEDSLYSAKDEPHKQ